MFKFNTDVWFCYIAMYMYQSGNKRRADEVDVIYCCILFKIWIISSINGHRVFHFNFFVGCIVESMHT